MPDTVSRRQKLILRWSPLVGRPFEFTTTLSTDECVRRLKWKAERPHSWLRLYPGLRVNIWQHENVIHYHLWRSATPNLTAEVSGLLEGLPDGTTRIIGVARIRSTHGWFMILLFLPVLFYIPFVLPLSRTLLLYGFFAALLTVVSAAWINECNRLTRLVRETMQA